MGAENQITSLATVKCGACQTDNQAESKFCKSCGQNLFESCAGCGKSVSLSQKFCGSCGTDLEEALQSTHQKHETRLLNAVAAARQYDYENAIAMLEPIAALKDFRFKQAAANAKQAIGKIESMRDRAKAAADKALAQAKQEFDRGNQAEVVRLLESVPAKLLDDNVKKILTRVKTHTSEVADLQAALDSAMQAKDWPAVGSLIDQLLVHDAENQQYRQIAQQITVKLFATAKQLHAAGRYTPAVEMLSAIPTSSRDEDYDRIVQSYHDTEWLSLQFDDEAFVTPMLGRLAVRFSKAAPSNSTAEARVKKMASTLKKADRSKRNPFPRWKASNRSWMGGRVELLGVPHSVDLGDDKLMRGCVGRFHVALGLALQGIGRSRVTEQFIQKKKLLNSIGWRKAKRCWGIDIGSAAIKAVCLAEGEDGVAVVDSYFDELNDPICRFGMESKGPGLTAEAIEKFLEAKEIGEDPVWVNLPASDLVNRFVRLPPVTDKQAASLLHQEVDQRMPIAVDDLAVVRWVGELEEDDVHGRPAMITAARKSAVDQRLELLREAGLEVNGLQGDTVAIANYVAYEFDEFLTPEESGEDEAPAVDAEAEDDQGDAEEIDYLQSSDQGTPAVAVVECGAATTSLVIVSAETHWVWTIETGGEDLTAALARRSKETHSDAEQLKRNPAAIAFPSKQYSGVEQRQAELRMRLERVLDDALKQNPRFRIGQSWCLGGGCLAHQWIRNLMLEKKQS